MVSLEANIFRMSLRKEGHQKEIIARENQKGQITTTVKEDKKMYYGKRDECRIILFPIRGQPINDVTRIS